MLLIAIGLLVTSLTTQIWAQSGFWTDNAWDFEYYNGSSNVWHGAANLKDDDRTVNLGVLTSFYLKGCWVKTYSNNNYYTQDMRWHYGIGEGSHDYFKDDGWRHEDNRTWNFYNSTHNFIDYNVIGEAPNNPGENTLWMYWELDKEYHSGQAVTSKTCYVNFTIPGFTTTSTSQTIVSALNSYQDETISFGKHYGTTLNKTTNCSITGTNASSFSVQSISETGVTVRFSPGASAGVKSATLTITDAHSKTCTITLTGKSKVTVTYNKGTNGGTGSDVTDDKVYNVSLTLRDKGLFTRTGYDQTKWNTNSSGSGGTEYALKGSYTSNSAITLYPTWTAHTYTVTLKPGLGGTGSDGTYKVAYDATGKTSMSHSITQTGYSLEGWYPSQESTLKVLAANGDFAATTVSGYITSGKWSKAADCDLYAHWTANTYKITFNANGGTITNNGSTYAEDEARKINATYAATVSGTMPTAQKDGYHFQGWYTSSTGGSKVINANGVWQTVANYTDSDKKWKRAENTILYARYTIGISSLTFTPNSVMPGEDVTVKANFATSGNPEGTYSFCYVLTTSDGTELEVQPDEWTQDGLSATFEAPYSAGQYSVEVRLYAEASHDCSSVGTPVASYTSHAQTFTVEETNAVTVLYRCGNIDVRPSTTVQATASRAATVTAPELTGLKFTGWTTSANVSYATGYTSTSNPVQIKASAAGTLTANYSQGPLFFKNTKNWSKVYVYFYKNANYFTTNSSGSEGTGSKTINTNFISGPHEMSVVPGTTDVYYYNGTIPANATCVAFTNTEMKNYNYFAGSTTTPCEVVRATSVNANKPMIVPVGNGAIWNQQKAKYYGHDEAPILMDWGYNLRGSFNDWSATKSEFTAPTIGSLTFTATAYLDAAHSTYQWKIYNGDLGYGRSDGQTLTKTSPTSNVLTNYNNQGYNLNVTSNIAGEYTFTLTYGIGTSTSNTNGASVENALLTNMKVTVNFPVVSGDFRLVYTGGSKPHPSNVIKKRANGLDTVNLFVAAGKSNYIKLQPCTATSNSSVTWTALGSCSAPTYQSGVNFATILSEGGPGTYNFIVQQDANGANSKIIKVEKYTGRYYVRTNCVNDDKWNYKLSKDAHAMIYSDYSTTLDKKPYSHYYVKDLHGTAGSPINIRFTVATDYSEAITDSVINGETSGDYKDYYGSESLNRTANVRFSYNQATNKIWRAYTEGPENDNYMLLLSNGTDVFKDNNGSKGAASASIKFADRNNWVYQIDVYANVGAYVKLTAQMHNSSGTAQVQYIKGTSASGFNANTAVQLLSSTTASNEHMRIIYDFKTDRMITAWLPSNTVTTNIDIDADVLLIRKHQEAGQSITISSGKKLSSIQTVYGVMQFDKDFLNDVSKSKYTRDLFWISFPFDVKLSDVFGFGTYGQHWIIEYYDGIERAQKGYWIDSPGFWKFVMPEERDDYILKANQGYVLALDLDELGTSASVWNNSVTTIYLYFPSSSTIGDLENMSSVTVDVPQDGYQCTIDRTGLNGAGTDINKNRTVADSYWHIIGAASYADAGRTDLGTSMPTITITNSVPYVYKWNSTTNLYQVHSTKNLTFDAMRGYMVQYNGANITWSNVSGHKTSVARRAEAEDEHFAEFKVALMQGEESLDHTFVRLSDEDEVTENFEFGHDMCKEFNGGKANIYSIVENYIPTAGNSLPMSLTQTTLVPLGVRIVTEGEYIFSIPEGTSGVGVSLIDNETGTRTNLGLTDYAVTLPAGDHNNRFVLEISPIVQVTTSVEQINGENSDAALNGVCKKLIDGVLYIIKEGKVFDARGARIQ